MYFYKARGDYVLYMGKDKHENEGLIEHSWPDDLWFHVDKMSSAHVYLRMKEGDDWRDLPPEVVEDCAQLVKANSIAGNKVNDVGIVYTPASNLKKTADMDIGQVGFKNTKDVIKMKVNTRKNEIINRLEKTETEEYPDLAAEKQRRMDKIRQANKQLARQQEKEKQALALERQQEKEARSYDRLYSGAAMKTNKDIDPQELEDDFM
mmetsp:Transcript_20305/g.47442  ORF Transcript_20305/g.47442 Transcript_20305/m.47442 type:complete len:207 (+) Transcript_20305:38-658(+)